MLALLAPAANAAQLRPDASSAPASDGLQPDAFPGSSTAKPVTAAPPSVAAPVGGSLAQVPAVSPPAAPKVTEPASTPAPAPRVEVPSAASAPPPAAIVPVRQVATKMHVAKRKAAKHAVHKVAKRHRAVEVARVQLPRFVDGILSLPVPHVRALPAPAAVRRDLLPAALALLALVATSACLLGVAARSAHGRLRI